MIIKKHSFEEGQKIWYKDSRRSFESEVVAVYWGKIKIKEPAYGQMDVYLNNKEQEVTPLKNANDILKEML